MFDGQELLEPSIRAIKSEVDYVCVVYQTVSNFGNPAHPHLEKLLKVLLAAVSATCCSWYVLWTMKI